jgi:hypothetical protein
MDNIGGGRSLNVERLFSLTSQKGRVLFLLVSRPPL